MPVHSQPKCQKEAPKNPLRNAFFGFASALKSQTSPVTSVNNNKQLFLDFARVIRHHRSQQRSQVVSTMTVDDLCAYYKAPDTTLRPTFLVVLAKTSAFLTHMQWYLNSKTRECGKLLQTRKDIHSHKDPSNIKKDNVDHGHDK